MFLLKNWFRGFLILLCLVNQVFCQDWDIFSYEKNQFVESKYLNTGTLTIQINPDYSFGIHGFNKKKSIGQKNYFQYSSDFTPLEYRVVEIYFKQDSSILCVLDYIVVYELSKQIWQYKSTRKHESGRQKKIECEGKLIFYEPNSCSFKAQICNTLKSNKKFLFFNHQMIPYTNGSSQTSGLVIEMNENNIFSIAELKKGELVKCLYFYPDGHPKQLLRYTNGTLDGVCLDWKPGFIVQESIYNCGQLISQVCNKPEFWNIIDDVELDLFWIAKFRMPRN